ncbi:MAG: hypothetical protein C0624_03500 [Desulfuromonas sp.]|nr:MAG: hypothetical protein C0624_03500 [Desulfuromonas sp.]
MDTRQRAILVVDNNHTFVMYLGLLLCRLGFSVFNAETPTAALELTSSQQIDAVICEGRTATFDGLKLLHSLRKQAHLSRIPVIVIATNGSRAERTIFLATGANDFLSKPLPPSQLHQSLHEFVRFETGTRRYPRIRLNQRVQVESSSGSLELYLTSLSEGGAFIRCDTPLPTGEEVTVYFPTPCGMLLPLRGHVLYNRQMFHTPECIEPGFAIHFRPLPVAQKKILSQYIEHLLAGDLEAFTTPQEFALYA